MSKFFTLCLLTLTYAVGVMAQDFTIADFECDQTDLTAQQRNIKDENGNPCSLLRVLLVDDGAKFAGSYTGDIEKLQNEYWLWMRDGAESISICTSSSSILPVNFADYGVNNLKGKYVYVLTVLSNTSTERRENIVSFKVEPSEAEIFIDNEKYDIASGYLTLVLPYGKHTYVAKAKDCTSQEGRFEVGKKQILTNIHLANSNASLSITTPSLSAEIFLDDESIGVSNWKGELHPGEHYVEVQDNGYTTGKQKIVLKEQEAKEVNLTPDIPMTGTLIISNVPSNVTLYLDGEKVGSSGTYTKSLLVGDHYVDVISDGWKSATYSFEIKKDQSHNINIALERGDGWQFDVRGVKFEMIYVEGGTFLMSYTGKVSPSSLARYRNNNVTVDSYYIGQYAIIQGLWTAIYGSPNKHNIKVGDNETLVELSWTDIKGLIEKLNVLTGKTFRLPTEAEWEFAAKGGNKSNGYKFSGAATYEESQGIPNELGIYDMTSQYADLCSDFYAKDLGSFPKTNPTGPTIETIEKYPYVVVRGGEKNNVCIRDKIRVEIPNIREGGSAVFLYSGCHKTKFRLVMDVPNEVPKIVSTTSKQNTSLTNESSKVEEIYLNPSYDPMFFWLDDYLSKNVKYPTKAKKKKITGDVIVSFVVECDGSITNVKVETPIEDSLDEEAKRVIENMPNWVPGKDSREHTIRVRQAISIGFWIKSSSSVPRVGQFNGIKTHYWCVPEKSKEKFNPLSDWGRGTSVRHRSQPRARFRRL